MAVLLNHRRWRALFALAMIVCLMAPDIAMAAHLKEDSQTGIADRSFFVLILGDSQMAGAGWEGGYSNCIREAYPNATVVNLAQNGNLLASGEILAQWEFFLTQELPMPDIVLFDGGINDLPYTQKAEFKDSGMTLVQDALAALIGRIHEESPDTRIIYTLMPPFEEWKDSENGPPSYDIQEHYWKQINITASAYDFVTVLDLFSLNPFRFPCAECYHENLADSIHLNEAGYRKTFEYIDNVLVGCLARMMDE